MTLPVAIVGAGLMGRWHATYASRAGGRVAAVVDRDAAAAARLAGRFGGARPFAALGDCLAQVETTVVHVCTGLESHAELARAALSAGRHVLVEKPLASTAEEVRDLCGLAAARNLQLAPVHQFPFQRGMLALRRELARLGRLVRVRYETATAGGDGRGADLRREVLLEILPHPVSLFFAVLGGIPEPAGWQVREKSSDALGLCATSGGVRLEIEVSLLARPTRNELLVQGTEGMARADLFHGFVAWREGTVSRAAKVSGPLREGGGLLAAAAGNLALRAWRREPAYPGLPELLRRFYSAVRGEGPEPVPRVETEAAARLTDHLRALP